MYKNLLSEEEMNYLKESNDKVIGAISKKDMLRAYCTHINERGESVVQPLHDEDNSGLVWCPICGAKWDPMEVTKEEIEKQVNEIIGHIQNIKFINCLPEEVGKKYYSVIAVLEKLPEIYEYVEKNFNHMMFMKHENAWGNPQEVLREIAGVPYSINFNPDAIPNISHPGMPNGHFNNIRYGYPQHIPPSYYYQNQQRISKQIKEGEITIPENGVSNEDFERPWMNVDIEE